MDVQPARSLLITRLKLPDDGYTARSMMSDDWLVEIVALSCRKASAR